MWLTTGATGAGAFGGEATAFGGEATAFGAAGGEGATTGVGGFTSATTSSPRFFSHRRRGTSRMIKIT